MMKNMLPGIVLAAMVVLHAAAVDMSLYSPTKDVEVEFQTFLKECVLLLLRTSLTLIITIHPTNLRAPPPLFFSPRCFTHISRSTKTRI